jgi:hypothetical protein
VVIVEIARHDTKRQRPPFAARNGNEYNSGNSSYQQPKEGRR